MSATRKKKKIAVKKIITSNAQELMANFALSPKLHDSPIFHVIALFPPPTVVLKRK